MPGTVTLVYPHTSQLSTADSQLVDISLGISQKGPLPSFEKSPARTLGRSEKAICLGFL
jgi:hypothetical protein